MTQHSFFQGIINEIPYILVDYFVHSRTTSAFFLSHCHADHMKGLDSFELLSYLQSKNDVFIYCSKITKAIISSWNTYSKLTPYLKDIDINQNVRIKMTNHQQTLEQNRCSTGEDETHLFTIEFFVTLIPAGHCPGSVMFLFEGNFGSILYSGDLRIAQGDSFKLKALMNNPSKSEYGMKLIDHLYLDCTFCCSNAQKFPSREDSLEKIIENVVEWTSNGPYHKVFFSLAGRGFGAEYVFLEIFKRLKISTHVSPFKYNIYQRIPHLAEALTLDSTSAIHACEDNGGIACKKSLQCSYGAIKVMTIRLTTQWHLMEGKNPDFQTVVNDGGVLRVLFSMHSSLDELQDFVVCLKPQKITPISKPDGVTIEEISRILKCPVCLPSVPITDSTSSECAILFQQSSKNKRKKAEFAASSRKRKSS